MIQRELEELEFRNMALLVFAATQHIKEPITIWQRGELIRVQIGEMIRMYNTRDLKRIMEELTQGASAIFAMMGADLDSTPEQSEKGNAKKSDEQKFPTNKDGETLQ